MGNYLFFCRTYRLWILWKTINMSIRSHSTILWHQTHRRDLCQKKRSRRRTISPWLFTFSEHIFSWKQSDGKFKDQAMGALWHSCGRALYAAGWDTRSAIQTGIPSCRTLVLKRRPLPEPLEIWSTLKDGSDWKFRWPASTWGWSGSWWVKRLLYPEAGWLSAPCRFPAGWQTW